MKTLKRALCLMLSIIMAFSCLSVAASAAEGEKFTSTLKTSTTVTNKESAKLTLDEFDKTLAEMNIYEEITFSDIGLIKLVVDLRSVSALCKTIDDYKGIITVASKFMGDLKDLNLKTWKEKMSRPNDDITILNELIELIGANGEIIKKVCAGKIDLGILDKFIDLKDILGTDGISGSLKEALISSVYDKDSNEFSNAYNTYKNDIDAFIYDKILPSFTEEYLPGLTVSKTSTIESLLIDFFNISFEKHVKPALYELIIDISDSDIPELKKLSKYLKPEGIDNNMTYSKEAPLKDQMNNVIGEYVKKLISGCDWENGGFDKFGTNIENVIKYIAGVSGIKGNNLKEIGVATTLLIVKNSDPEAYEAGLKNCTTPEKLAAAFLINIAKEMKIGVNYTGNESYLVVAGDILAALAYDNLNLTDYNGNTYRPGGGKDIFEVANYLVNHLLFDRAGAGVSGLSVSKTDSIFTKIDKIADYFAETKAKGVNFDSENFTKGIINAMFTLDIGKMFELTIVPILDNAGPVPAEKFLYNTAYYFMKNWANGNVVIPAYTEKAFTNALSNESIGNAVETFLSVISARRADVVTLSTFAIAVLTYAAKEYPLDISISKLTATGKALTPQVTVKANGKTLVQNTDYFMFADPAVTPGTYKLTIKGIGMYSGEFEKSYTVSMPSVSTLTSGNPTTSSVTLTWGKALYADSYTVSVYNSAKKAYVTHKAGITGTSYTVTGLSAGSEYKFSVQAVSSAYGKSAAKEITVYTVPSAVTKLTAMPNVTSVKLSWAAVTGATHYKVEYKSASDSAWKTATTATSTACTVSGLSSYTNYSFRVTAIKNISGGTSLTASAATVSTNTLPDAISSLEASATSTTMTLTWPKVARAEKYEISQYKDNKWVTVATTDKTSYTVSNLKSATQYKFSVRAVGGNSYYGSAKEISTYTAPSAVSSSKLKASTTASSVKLSWAAVTGATHYKIEQYSSKKWKTVATTEKTAYTIKSLSGYTSYTFRVTALKKLSDGTYLSATPVQIKAETLLGTPSSLKASATASTMTLTWSKVNGAEKYQIRQYTGGKWKTVATTSKTSYKISKLKANTKYKFSVRAVVGKSTYGSAKEISAYTLLPTPTKVKASSTTTTTAKLSWSKVKGASSYEVYAYINSKWTKVATSKKTAVTVKKLPSGKKTKLKVRAVSKNVKSAFSSEISVLTLVAKVSSLKTSLRKTNSITLTWKKTTGATSYEVYRYTGGKWKKIGTTTKTTYTDSKSLTKGTEYQYKVRAVQKVNKKTTRYGDYSAVLKAKTTVIGSSKR